MDMKESTVHLPLFSNDSFLLSADGKIVGKTLTLGLYSHDHEWREEDRLNDALKYHSQFYTNGTECDLTGSYRKTDVKVKLTARFNIIGQLKTRFCISNRSFQY